MKRIAFILAAAFLLAACAKKNSEKVVIEFWTHEDVNRQNIEDRYIAEFMEAHPNVTVNAVRQSSVKIMELVKTAFAAGTGPTIFNVQLADASQYIWAGRVAHVDYKAAGFKDASHVINSYAPKMLDPMLFEGEVYGLPLEIVNWCIFVNKKVFRDAGLDAEKDYPKTWEDMVRVSEKIVKRSGDIITRRGYDFRYKYYLENCVPMVEQLGGELISADGKEAIVGKEAWVKFLTFMQEWGPNGKNLGSPTYKAARSLFNADNNDIAMCSTGLYQEARIKHDNPAFYDSGEWMVIPYPVFEGAVRDVSSCYYGQYYMVNADATKAEQKAAWELISYMLSHGEEYLEGPNLPQPTNKIIESERFKNMPYSDVFQKDLQRSHVVYYGKASPEIQSALSAVIEQVMLQGVSPEEAYETLKKTVQELISE